MTDQTTRNPVKSSSPPLAEPNIWLLDASIYIFHAWFGIPDHFRDRRGRSINALFGFAKTLLSLLQQQPRQVVCAFDESLFSGLRHQLDPDYKCSRVLPDDDLAYQLKSCVEFSRLMGLPSLTSRKYEADDLLASARYQWFPRTACTVITADKDLAQLMRPGDLWWHPVREEKLDYLAMVDRWGVEARLIADLLAVMGDRVDDIPGVPGIGAKTAATLIRAFGGLQPLLDNLHLIETLEIRGARTLAAKIEPFIERIALNYQLTQLYIDAPLPNKPKPWKPAQIDWQALDKKLKLWQFPGTVTRQIDLLRPG